MKGSKIDRCSEATLESPIYSVIREAVESEGKDRKERITSEEKIEYKNSTSILIEKVRKQKRTKRTTYFFPSIIKIKKIRHLQILLASKASLERKDRL